MYGHATATMPTIARFRQDRRLVRVTSTLDPEPFVVHHFHGSEAVSRPFAFTADLLSPDATLELKQVIGQPMGFTLQTPDGERHFHGYVKEFARTGTDGDLATYRAEVAPWFDFLRHTSNCRIFQDMTVLDIVDEVFARYPGLAEYSTDATASRYAKMPYCVQYNESDFAFVSRLLEDAGIHYYFEHSADAHVLKLADDSTRSPAIGPHPTVHFQSDQGVREDDGLDGWTAIRRIGAGLKSHKSFDFKQPRNALSADRLLDPPHGVLPVLEHYRYDGAARFGDSSAGSALAGLRGEELSWQTKLFEARGTCRSLRTGHYFVLQGHYDHAETDEESRQFFLLGVKHDARNNFKPDFSAAEGCVYRAEAVCLRRKIPYRPPCDTPLPYMRGPQTATVVGPAGEEIWTDAYGRVKVQFHWDRLGQLNERSSCWVRVSSPWAGPGMGGVSAPRIGQEVVVDFLDGDPDRPIVTGRVYNKDNPQPFDKHVSGIRSKTVQGEGFNELTMHDAAGSELLNMRAQRDMATTVLNDHSSSVGSNKSTSVGASHSLEVGADQSIAVGGNQDISVKGSHSSSITGSSTHTIAGALGSTVAGAVSETYQAGHTRNVTGGYDDTVVGGYNETITGNYASTLNGNHVSQRNGTLTETVTGTSMRTVLGATTENHNASRTTTVAANDTHQVGGNLEQEIGGQHKTMVASDVSHVAGGKHEAAAGGPMTLASGSKMTLQVGGAGIEIVGGSIVISAAGSTIRIDGGGVSINGAKISLN